MLICEAMLLSIIAMLGVYATYTDINRGIIKNKALIIATVIGIIINIFYYYLFCREFVIIYFENLLIISLFAVALYGFHFWAAGDSKLLICVNVLFPARFYDNSAFSIAPGFNAIIFIFLIAYGYVVIDSILNLIKKRKFYAGQLMGVKAIKSFLKSYLVSFIYLRGLGEILRNSLGEIYYHNQILFSFANVFFAILIYNHKFLKKWYMLVIAILANIAFIRKISFDPVSIYCYLILLLALVLRYLLNGYNYEEINTDNVLPGMVLSYGTVFQFSVSKVKNLPTTTHEDMRSRLTVEEVEAIKRWRNSKYGKEKIVIVRKIPFAIFVVLGEILFFFVRIWR